jgi:hypothetical protein
LLVYWLRYTCLLLLEKEPVESEAVFPLFHFPAIRAEVRAGRLAPTVQQALDNDYAVLTRLLDSARMRDVETRLLLWDYRLLRCWRAVTAIVSPPQSRQAVAEMANVLAVLATRLRQSTASAC